MRLDVHTHGYTNWARGRYSLEREPREPVYILRAIREAGLDGIALANYGDSGTWRSAYEQFAEMARDREKTGEFRLAREIDNCLVFDTGLSFIYVIKAQEIPTETPTSGKGRKKTREGHVLAIGHDKGAVIKSRMGLKDALIEVKKTGAIASADHYNGLLGVGRDQLIENADLFDTFEGFNGNYGNRMLSPLLGMNPSPEEADELSRETGLNWLAVSDCHNRNDYGVGHINIHGHVEFGSSSVLRDSLREVISKGEFTPVIRRPISVTSVLGHVFLAYFDVHIRSRLGLVNLESY